MSKTSRLIALTLVLAIATAQPGAVWGQSSGGSMDCTNPNNQYDKAIGGAAGQAANEKNQSASAIVSKYGASNIAQAAGTSTTLGKLSSGTNMADPFHSLGGAISGLLSGLLGKLMGGSSGSAAMGSANQLASNINSGSGNGCNLLPQLGQGSVTLSSGSSGGCSNISQPSAGSVPGAQQVPFDKLLPQ